MQLAVSSNSKMPIKAWERVCPNSKGEESPEVAHPLCMNAHGEEIVGSGHFSGRKRLSLNLTTLSYLSLES